jgi:uncharacterized protein YndB with AHSA1/START domain
MPTSGSAQTVTDGREVQIVHLFDAPRERVFQAWMDPDDVSRWWAPEGLEVPPDSVQIEAQAGGRFHLTMLDPRDGTAYPMRATILEIDVPKLIVLRTEPLPNVGIPHPTITRVTFQAIGQRTRMIFTAGPYPDDVLADSQAGWNSIVSKLDQLLRG